MLLVLIRFSLHIICHVSLVAPAFLLHDPPWVHSGIFFHVPFYLFIQAIIIIYVAVSLINISLSFTIFCENTRKTSIDYKRNNET